MSDYEFSSEENNVILSLAKRMQAVSLLLGLTGFFAIANAVHGLLTGVSPTAIGGLIAGAFAILQSIVFFRPTDNLKKIALDEGEDISELMRGIGELAAGLKIIVILLVVMALVAVASVAMSSR